MSLVIGHEAEPDTTDWQQAEEWGRMLKNRTSIGFLIQEMDR